MASDHREREWAITENDDSTAVLEGDLTVHDLEVTGGFGETTDETEAETESQ